MNSPDRPALSGALVLAVNCCSRGPLFRCHLRTLLGDVGIRILTYAARALASCSRSEQPRDIALDRCVSGKYAVEYEVVAGTSFDLPLIDLRLRKARLSQCPLVRLERRRTLRKGYGNQLLRVEDVRAVTSGASDFRCFPGDGKAARFLSQATIEANRVQAYRDPAQEELAEWIRWSKKDQLRLRNAPNTRWYGDRMTGPDSVAGLIETGRRFQRMWLLLREHSIAIHPMSQVLEESSDTTTVARELGIEGVPQFVLRIG